MVQSLSRIRFLLPHGLQLTRLVCSWDSPGDNTGVGCHFLPQMIFPTQKSNPWSPAFQADSAMKQKQMLILPVHEHGISFHLCMSTSIYFISALQISIYRSFASLIKFVSRYFIYSDAMLIGIVSLNSLCGISQCLEMQCISVY